MNCIGRRVVLFLCVGLLGSPALAALQELADDSLADISGQALFLADKIAGNLTGSDSLSTPFTYYRIGIDGNLEMNMNINKLQLGCGGFNEGIAANACDLDADFMSLSGTTNSGGPTSDFVMQRPYMEIAIKNDGDKTRREVVGVKIGAQLASGLMSIGRTYANGATNQEWGGTCNGNYGDNIDNGSRLACNSGANRISGFMNAELSGRGTVVSVITSGACFGWTRANTGDKCGAAQQDFVAVAGTRMNEIAGRNLTLKLDSAILGIDTGYADIRENLRMLHRIVLGPANKDFFLSWQRERLRWPIYNYTAPYDTDGFFPIGGAKNGDTTSRAYHYPANTGWWMNIQNAEVLDAAAGTINLDIFEVLGALGEGANMYNFNSGQTANDNCFGSQVFC